MKVMTILGTRPEIIRLSLIIPKLDRWTQHTLIHTGQNYEPELDSILFETMKIRRPEAYLDSGSESLFGQIAKILVAANACVVWVRLVYCVYQDSIDRYYLSVLILIQRYKG